MINGEQLSMWDGATPLKIDKPLRLIELFAGIGAQAKALERLGVPFEHYRICEFDKYAVTSYNAIHGTNFETSDIRTITGADGSSACEGLSQRKSCRTNSAFTKIGSKRPTKRRKSLFTKGARRCGKQRERRHTTFSRSRTAAANLPLNRSRRYMRKSRIAKPICLCATARGTPKRASLTSLTFAKSVSRRTEG